MKCLCLASIVGMLIPTAPCAQNLDGSLAIHLVASDEYLQCEDLCPAGMTCEDVNCDLSVAELEASGGYGYAAFLAYDLDEVSAVEFCVVGWPIGPGTPDFGGPHYCPLDAQWAGEPFEKRGGSGGYVSIGCQYPCTGMVCVCAISFGPEIWDWLPITLEYAPSTYSYPSGLSFYDLCVTMQDIPLVHEHPAVIGGACDPIPNCSPGPSGNDRSTWGAVKTLYR